MDASAVVFTGTHRGKPSKVTFALYSKQNIPWRRRRWRVTLNCDGIEKTASDKDCEGLWPCVTHADALMKAYFPSTKKRVSKSGFRVVG